MTSECGHIGVLMVELHFPASNSLKSKRRVLVSIKERIKSRFNVSVAETGHHDKWQISVVGICMIANDRRHIDEAFQKIILLITSIGETQLTHQTIEWL